MAVTMADITKLRKMTGAGMMDCKNALTEAEGDFDNIELCPLWFFSFSIRRICASCSTGS